MKGAGNLQARIVELMTEKGKPTDLWTYEDVMTEFDDLNKRQAENALYNAFLTGKIYRHKDANEDKQIQFALQIKEGNRFIKITGPRNMSPGPKKRKGVKPTAKEIRMAFMDLQRAFTRLEDLVMPVVESAEDKDKALERLRNIL